MVRSEGWPAPLVSNTKYLPDYGGVLPDEVRIIGDDPEAELARRGYANDEIAEREPIEGGLRVITHGEVRHPSSIADVLQAISEAEGARLSHSIRPSGEIEIEAYFADYDTFLYWFDAFALMALGASRLGGSGAGVFLADDDCEEPVVFELGVGERVKVDAIDPQDAQSLYERWGGRMDAAR